MKKHLEAKVELVLISLVLIASIFAFFLLNNSTAWFANNDKVDGSGISLSAKATSNLIISKNSDDITAGIMCFDVDFKNTERDNMIAVTHDQNVPVTYLKYVTNHYAIDNITGNAFPGATLEFAPVPETDNERYFVDYTIYLASITDSIDASSLTATITVPDQSYLDKDYVNAVSIDFYVNTVSAEGYRGTTSIAKSVSDADDKSVNLFDSSGGVIPHNTEGYITVIMRCYFDGALIDDKSGNAYINSYTVESDRVFLGVQFVARDKN